MDETRELLEFRIRVDIISGKRTLSSGDDLMERDVEEGRGTPFKNLRMLMTKRKSRRTMDHDENQDPRGVTCKSVITPPQL